MTDAPTVAQEVVTIAMVSALVSCAALSLVLVEVLALHSLDAYAILAMTSMAITGYVVPNVTAMWLGRSIDDIMRDDGTRERRGPTFR